MDSGRGFLAKDRTTVRVLKDHDYDRIDEGHSVEFRILDGEQKGKIGYTFSFMVCLSVEIPIKVGDEGVIRLETEFIPLAHDEDSYAEMVKLLRKKSSLKSLERAHKVVWVESGVRMKLLYVGDDYCKVNILSGRYKGQNAFVNPSSVRDR